MEHVHPAHPRRWVMLAMATMAFIELGLNWFDIVPALPFLARQLGISLVLVSGIVSAFFFGYGGGHIPIGFLTTRLGVKRVFVGGLLLQSITTGLLVLGHSYAWVLTLRVLAGLGGTAVAATAFNIGVAWFPAHEKKLALGIIGGPGLTIGAAAGLYLWTVLDHAVGWRAGMLIAAVVGVVIGGIAWAFTASPPGVNLEGQALTRESFRATLASRDLWGLGIGLLGVYGAWITVSELSPSFVTHAWHFSANAAGLLSGLVLFIGLPAGILGGLVADRAARFVPVMSIPAFLAAFGTAVVPLGPAGTWVGALAVGFLFIFLFTPISAAPSEYAYIPLKDYATAVGFLITLGDVGAFVDPLIYAKVATAFGAATAWWVIAGITLVCCIGFAWAREPRSVIVPTTSFSAERGMD